MCCQTNTSLLSDTMTETANCVIIVGTVVLVISYVLLWFILLMLLAHCFIISNSLCFQTLFTHHVLAIMVLYLF